MTWRRTPAGILVRDRVLAGIFRWRKRGGPWHEQRNLITDEGAAYLTGDGTLGTWFVAPFGTDIAPANDWTAATFAATAGEIGDPPEGYVEAARPSWPYTQAVVGNAYYDNYSDAYVPATIHVATASQLQICGFGLLNDNTKGGTSGALLAAVRFTDAPVLYDDNDIVDIFYRLAVVAP